MSRAAILILLSLVATPLSAQGIAVDTPLAHQQLADPAKEAEASALMETLRCIQCQGQSIADSDAPIAAAMRAEVRQRIEKGESADSIRNWMVARYGQFVSFEPAMRGSGLLLWLTPLLLLAAAMWFARGMFRKPVK